ncbi:MAG: hypothetical protein R3E58_17180 [Phycisphaerae bacterium]
MKSRKFSTPFGDTGDVRETTSPYTPLVAAAADAVSASPGGRRESLEQCIKRLEQRSLWQEHSMACDGRLRFKPVAKCV